MEIKDDTLLWHICENCGKKELLTPSEAYKNGWEYPPIMGSFKVVSPRTCGCSTIDKTLYWELISKKTPPEKLSEKQKETLLRILKEPESILPTAEEIKNNS